jgi:predicted lipoprotein with Yx(FWY)xxD motif
MHRRIGWLTSLVTVTVLALSVAGYGSVQAGGAAAVAHAAKAITIQNFAFSPTTLTIPVGTTVTWTNQDSTAHTVTSDTGAWPDSGSIDTGKSFSVTFKKAGTFTYHCAIHATMTASIVVGAASSASSGAALVKLAAAHILVNAKGMTIYTFALDTKDKSACYKTCAKYWPPVLVAKGITPPATMTGVPGTFGAASRTDGTQQLTYDGAPLYTFLGDKKPGDLNGQGSTASGGYWWAVVAGGK